MKCLIMDCIGMNAFNPKAVSKLMGHAKEIITIDVYGDNQGIIAIAGCVPEIAFDG